MQKLVKSIELKPVLIGTNPVELKYDVHYHYTDGTEDVVLDVYEMQLHDVIAVANESCKDAIANAIN